MKTIIDKNIGTLVHIYDFLNEGYFASHNQLKYYNEKAYNLYVKNDREKLKHMYDKLKIELPAFVISTIENSNVMAVKI